MPFGRECGVAGFVVEGGWQGHVMMRLFMGLTLTFVTAATLTGGSTQHATAAAAMTTVTADPRRPTCATGAGSFPVRTRVHGGPDSYDAGGGYGTWSLELTNTTSRTCRNIHPVIVLVDEKRALRPAQPRLEFYAGARPHPVPFERTDADELVGVLDHDGFPGFTVRPHRTLTVTLRLAVTSEARPNDVVANAAVVQRRGDDGEWVGESNDYRFRIVDSGGGADRKEEHKKDRKGDRKGDDGDGGKEEANGHGTGRKDGTGTGTGTGRDQGTGTDPDQGRGTGTHPDPGQGTGTRTDPDPGQADGTGTDGNQSAGTGDGTGTGTGVREEHLTLAEELARTGGSETPGVIAVLLLATGTLLVTLARRKSR